MERNLTKMAFATAIMVISPAIASSQALLSDQRDLMAHMANVAVAIEECGMRVDQELLDATMAHVGVVRVDLETEPYKSAFERAAQEAQISLETLGRDSVCERLDFMYGGTGVRVPGLLDR